jgi:hypothetical protein
MTGIARTVLLGLALLGPAVLGLAVLGLAVLGPAVLGPGLLGMTAAARPAAEALAPAAEAPVPAVEVPAPRGACYCRAGAALQCAADLTERDCRRQCDEAACDDWFWRDRLPCWNWGYGG